MGVLIEHYAGAFPSWLAPVQARILPVGESFVEYGKEVFELLKKEGFRVEIDDSGDTLGKKIRNAEMMKIPYMLVVGEQERDSKSVAARNYETKKQEVISLEDFVKLLKSQQPK